eukprot:2126630-Amphidinium_carterae.1
MNAGKAPPGAATAKPPPTTTSKAPPPTGEAGPPPPPVKAPPGAKATSGRASSRGKTTLPTDKQDGSKVKYASKYMNLDLDDF